LKLEKPTLELALKTLRKYGFSQTEAQVYFYLSKMGPCTQKELAKATGLDTAQLNRCLLSLQTKGFITYLTATCKVISAVPLEAILENLEKTKLAEAQRLKQSRDTILAGSKPKSN
jgi:sugar-specific transcriptional regulator TrmB